MHTAIGRWLRRAAGLPVILTGLVLANAAAVADEYRPIAFRHLTVADGLSQNTVMDVHQDSVGYIWLATENGLDRYDGHSVQRYQRGKAADGDLGSDFIWKIAEDDQTNLWLATQGAGLAYWNRQTDRFRHFQNDPKDPASLSGNQIRSLLLTRSAVWAGTLESGLNRLDLATGQVTRYRHDPEDAGSLPDDGIYALLEDESGRLWVGTDAGLAWLEPGSGRFERLLHDPEDPESLSHDRIRALHLDRHGSLWVGTFGGGVNAMNPRTGRFTRYLPNPEISGALSHGHVWAILEDDVGRIWIATANGLNLLLPGTQHFQVYQAGDRANELSDSYVMSLHQDRGGVIWVGTRFGGVNSWNSSSWELGHHRPDWLAKRSITSFASVPGGYWIGTFGGGLTFVDEQTGAERHLSTTSEPAITDDRVMALLVDQAGYLWIGTMEGGINRLSTDGGTVEAPAFRQSESEDSIGGVMSLFQDSHGWVWIGTFGNGVIRVDPGSGQRDPQVVAAGGARDACGTQGRAFTEDSRGAIWIATEQGLCLYDPKTAVFHAYRSNQDDPESLSENSVYALKTAEDGTVWIGTGGGGLNRILGTSANPGQIRFKRSTRRDGLSSNIIYAIQIDENGQLWLSSNNGLSRFDPETGAVRIFRSRQGLQGDEFHHGASHKDTSGNLYFGGANGYNRFDPRALTDAADAPAVVLTGLSTENRPITPVVAGRDREPLALSYLAPAVTFEFSALDFTEPEQNRYAYRLRGFDENWIEAGSRRTASYTNLPGGQYEFQVKAANSAGQWNESGLSIGISVAPAPWTTTWAKLSYALALFAALWAYAYWHRRRLTREAEYSRRLENDVQERTEALAHSNRELKKLTEMKSEFLARMSHEIRSPINGILGMTELLARSPLDETQQRFAKTITTSGESLLHIINDILDFSKLESGMVELEVLDVDLEALLCDTAEMFALEADRRGLELVVNLPVNGVPQVKADGMRLKQVLINLLNNALKFTEHGHVLLELATRPAGEGRIGMTVSIADTGIGIAEENHQRIFESFSQEDGSTTRRFGGTGLGLAICRELLALMDSELTLTSASGQGSRFQFDLELARSTANPAESVSLTGGALIVCQPPILSSQLARYLDAWGLNCNSVSSADAALDLLNGPTGENFGLIVMDDRIARAAEIVKSLSDHGPAPSCRCLMLHGFDSQAEQSGPQLTRPVRRRALRQAVLEALELPVADETAEPAEPDNKLLGRVLMVEDNPVNQEVMSGMLTELGCSVRFASDGLTGYDMALEGGFDAVLMDLQLPDISGAEVTRRLRAAGGDAARLPIIALTANASQEDARLCRDAGMDAFLTKPCSLDQLAQTLSRWLPAATPAELRMEEASAGGHSEAGFDELALARVKRLRRPDGTPMLAHAVQLFERTARESLATLRGACDGTDPESLRFAAHKLKSGCANLGAVRMADLCRQLEEIGRTGTTAGAADLITMVESEFAEVQVWLEEQVRESA